MSEKISLAKFITLQELFQEIWNGAKKQEFVRSKNEEGLCQYKNSKGLKCNAGMLIPQELYTPKFEEIGGGFEALCKIFSGTGAQIKLIEFTQFAHDDADSPEDHESRLRDVAKQYGFTIID